MIPAGVLPAPALALIGRDEDSVAVQRLLLTNAPGLVTLTGPPGVGKTSLAIAVADGIRGQFADGAVWVDLAPVRDRQLLMAEIARAVGVARPSGGAAAGELLRSALAEREVLLVLDNCEHLLEETSELRDLLASSRRIRVLATSRERLRLAVEREYPVRPLAMPLDEEVADLERMASNPAITLLLARAPSHVSLTARTAQSLADICVRLDGLPLALELAAARLRVFTPSELAFRLEHRMALLTGGPRDAPARHRDLRAAIAWSHDLLPQTEQTTFRRLSVFVGDWTLEAAEAACADAATPSVFDSIESLLEKNLIRRLDTEGGAARFGMLMSLREFAAEQLDLHGEAAAVRSRHAKYFAAEARRWEATVGTNDETAAWSTVGLIRQDLRAAFEHASAAGSIEDVLWLGTGLGWYWYTRGSLADARPLIDVVALGIADARSSPDARAAALIACGIVAFGLGDLETADRDLRRSAAISAERGDLRRVALAEAFLGSVARGQGHFDEAAEHHAIARTLYERLGNNLGTAWAAHDLGLLAAERGDVADAEPRLREALWMFDTLDYDWAVAASACALATVLVSGQSVAEPAILLGRAITLHEAVGDRRGIAQCLESLAEVAFARGSPVTAARLLGAAGAQRDAVAALPTEAEQARIGKLDNAVVRTLGRTKTEQERRTGRALPAPAANALARRVAATGTTGAEVAAGAELTPRQFEVAALIAASNTNRQIASALGISEKTAEVHVRNIMERLHTPNRAGVAAWVAARAAQAPP